MPHQNVSTFRSLRTRWDAGLLWFFLLFTIFAVSGYGVFGRHPALLSDYPSLLAWYGKAFLLFGRGHVLIGAAVLGIYLTRRTGWRWIRAFSVIYLISLTSETLGTTYGFPFGVYRYTDLLGMRLFDRVPLLIPLSWFLMALPAYVLARSRFARSDRRVPRLLLGAGLLTLWDLSLDPAMSYLTKYWQWGESGVYYGMPLINLAGWFITGLAIMLALELLQTGSWSARLSIKWLSGYFAITLLMPFGMIFVAGVWGAVLATLFAGAAGWMVLSRSPGDDTSAGDPVIDTPEDSAVSRSTEVIPNESVQDWARSFAGEVGRTPSSDFFRHHSRSFSFAARLFPSGMRHQIAGLYVFCRVTDDLVDAGQDEDDSLDRKLDAWRDLARSSYEGVPSGITWLDELMTVTARNGAPFELIDDLVEGVRMDLGGVSFQTMADLDLYTYRVASVVGIWICYLHGISDPEVLQRAAALGRAMQITNILRDVGEDLEKDRVYLPASLLSAHGVTREDLHRMANGAPVSSNYREVIEELIAHSEADYDFAFPGLAVLPLPFARASAVAAGIYRGIHGAIRRNRYDTFTNRAFTTFIQKVVLSTGALYRLRRLRRNRTQSPGWTAPNLPSGSLRARIAEIGYRMIFALFMLVQTPAGAVAMPTGLSWPPDTTPPAILMNEISEGGTESRLEQLRALYLEAVNDRQALDDGLELAATAVPKSAVIEAYEGAFKVLKAKHAFWPFRKMAHLNDGLPILDSLVSANPDHVEIRYLRLMSCYYLPGFLGRKGSVQEDFEALSRLLPDAVDAFPPTLFEDMVRFVLEEAETDEPTRARLQASLPEGETP